MNFCTESELAAWFAERYPAGHPEGIIFDCDGVVIDSRNANIAYYNFYREYIGLPRLTQQQEDFVHAATLNQALDAIIPVSLRPLLKYAAQKISYDRDILPRITCFPDLHNVLRFCRKTGIRCGMATNRCDGMETLIAQCRLQGFFDPIVLATDVPNPKPAPDGALRIAAEWKLAPSRLLFIGDSTSDRGAAENAGIPFLAFQTKGLAERAIADFATLLGALQNQAGSLPQHFTAGDL